MIFKVFKNQFFWLGIIILLGFALRLYKIDNPIADWHAWRQADTAAVARDFYKEGFNPLVPKYDDMTGWAEKPVPNPGRFRFVEFPIYNSLVYFTYLLNGGVDDKLARLVSVVFSLGSIIFLYLITRRYFGTAVAMCAALLFAILPFNVYFSRTVLPEPTLVFFSLGMFYFTDRWIFENTRGLYFLSVAFAALALLVKPMAIFYLLPLGYSYLKKEKKIWPIPKRYLFYLVPVILPLVFWRVWMTQYPEGIPASNWLLNGNGIRFKPAFWKWILGERLGGEILTVPGIVLFFIGLLKKSDSKKTYLLHFLALSSFLFLIIFATGNVQHNYYQTLIIPALVIFVARGFVSLFQGIPGFVPRVWTIPLAILFLSLVPILGWEEVQGFYKINNPVIVEAGKAADRILPKDAIVIAPYGGDTSFLYQTNRPGWPEVAFPTEEMVQRFKVTDYVSVNYDAKTNWEMRKYKVLLATPKFVIVDLTKKNPNFDNLHDLEPPQ
ncbi:MAG: glycosyltransferase family 39 protein [Patescibacteria group bacterium]|nr:glycosyltransferase family 39 protein [Patescibacteria group bacterium]